MATPRARPVPPMMAKGPPVGAISNEKLSGARSRSSPAICAVAVKMTCPP